MNSRDFYNCCDGVHTHASVHHLKTIIYVFIFGCMHLCVLHSCIFVILFTIGYSHNLFFSEAAFYQFAGWYEAQAGNKALDVLAASISGCAGTNHKCCLFVVEITCSLLSRDVCVCVCVSCLFP